VIFTFRDDAGTTQVSAEKPAKELQVLRSPKPEPERKAP
jgi:hypothetical protein